MATINKSIDKYIGKPITVSIDKKYPLKGKISIKKSVEPVKITIVKLKTRSVKTSE